MLKIISRRQIYIDFSILYAKDTLQHRFLMRRHLCQRCLLGIINLSILENEHFQSVGGLGQLRKLTKHLFIDQCPDSL